MAKYVCLRYKAQQRMLPGFTPQLSRRAPSALSIAPRRLPVGKQGQVLTVEFTVLGTPCLGLDGGPAFKHSEAFSFQVITEDQAETDRYWNAIVCNGGAKARAGGARTAGACPGRSPRVHSWKRRPVRIRQPPSARSRR